MPDLFITTMEIDERYSDIWIIGVQLHDHKARDNPVSGF